MSLLRMRLRAGLKNHRLNHSQRKYFLRLTKAVLYAGTAIFQKSVRTVHTKTSAGLRYLNKARAVYPSKASHERAKHRRKNFIERVMKDENI